MFRIELARRLSGVTARALADRLGVHPTVLSQVERGARKPYPALRRKIADALGYPEEILFGLDGWPIKVEGGDFEWINHPSA